MAKIKPETFTHEEAKKNMVDSLGKQVKRDRKAGIRGERGSYLHPNGNTYQRTCLIDLGGIDKLNKVGSIGADPVLAIINKALDNATCTAPFIIKR